MLVLFSAIFAIAVITIATLSITLTVCISVIRLYMESTWRLPRLLRVIAFE